MRSIIGYITLLLLCCLFAGCATNRVTLGYTGRWMPTLGGSINGVSGYFVIDTGSSTPILTQAAIKRCHIVATAGSGFGYGVGGKFYPMVATNITLCLAQGVTVHLRSVEVFPILDSEVANTNDNFFGLLDCKTLAARGAVIDMTRKTITLTK